MMVDKWTANLWLADAFNCALDAVEAMPSEMLDLEKLARMLSRRLIVSTRTIVPDPTTDLMGDLARCAAYGLSSGALDRMYFAKSDVIRDAREQRQAEQINN